MPKRNVPQIAAPSILQGIPKWVIRGVEADQLLWDALLASKHPDAASVAVALHMMSSELAAARRQRRRIVRAERSLAKSRSTAAIPGIFADVHFYVICGARIAKLAQYVSAQTKWRRVGLVRRKYYQDLDALVRLRDHFEHFEERLPGGPRNEALLQRNDLGNLSPSEMTFGGERFELGHRNLEMLRSFFKAYQQAIVFDAAEQLGVLDKDLLRHRLQRVYTDRETGRVIKSLSREGEPT